MGPGVVTQFLVVQGDDTTMMVVREVGGAMMWQHGSSGARWA